MKRTAYLIPLAMLLALLISLIGGAVASAQDFPEYRGFVNDYAGIISDNGTSQLEAQLAQLEKDTSAEVAVVTIQSLQGEPLEDYANKLFEKWGIGKKGKDNGVLLLVSVDDRKMRIEVGYGIEPIITDSRAGRIRDDDIIPLFKGDDYEGGIVAGVNSIEKYWSEDLYKAIFATKKIGFSLGLNDPDKKANMEMLKEFAGEDVVYLFANTAIQIDNLKNINVAMVTRRAIPNLKGILRKKFNKKKPRIPTQQNLTKKFLSSDNQELPEDEIDPMVDKIKLPQR